MVPAETVWTAVSGFDTIKPAVIFGSQYVVSKRGFASDPGFQRPETRLKT